MYNILICDDQVDIVNALKIYLAPEGYRLFEAFDGAEALRIVREQDIHLVLLDIMMPKMDGITATAKIREFSNVPIILLTAKSETEDMVLGLNVGADDYITKPFSNDELLLRMKSVLRRAERNNPFTYSLGESKIKIGRFIFDAKNMLLILDGQEQPLTRKEAALLKVLYDNKNDLVTRKKVLKMIWGNSDYFIGRSMDVFIARLRKYLKADPNVRILTVHGVGFRLVVTEPALV